ncbi:hypothetical protein F5Y08DRAFT_298052 [Xylaria arbuscula]|nr:hypothetical protein F5Y08DRAFT_298052 [Xylaria arbuscula]
MRGQNRYIGNVRGCKRPASRGQALSSSCRASSPTKCGVSRLPYLVSFSHPFERTYAGTRAMDAQWRRDSRLSSAAVLLYAVASATGSDRDGILGIKVMTPSAFNPPGCLPALSVQYPLPPMGKCAALHDLDRKLPSVLLLTGERGREATANSPDISSHLYDISSPV